MSAVLLRFCDNDCFTVRDLLNGGISTMGRTGSGKSSSAMRELAFSLAALPGSGGLILAAKPEDRAFWTDVFEKVGRTHDFLILGPNDPNRFNFLEYAAKMGGHARNITRTIMTIGETLNASEDKGGGEDGEFWKKQQERTIYNAVVVLMIATRGVNAPELQRFITSSAQTPQQLLSEDWQAGFHNRCLEAAFLKEKTEIDGKDFELAMDFWGHEVPNLADRTRTSIMTGVLGILHTFNTGVVRQLVSTTTTITPEDLFNGKWLLVDMSTAEWGDMGRFVATGCKYLTERAILRRHAKPEDNIVTIWCDEAQQYVNGFDAQFIAECRSHRGCLVYLTQSLHSYYAALKGTTGRHQADVLLSNFTTKIFHALGDVQTAEWASSLIGRSLQTFIGGSTPRDEEPFGLLAGGGGGTGSFSEHFEAVVQPNEFMNGLRTGAAGNDFICDAIVIRSGQPFASGSNWKKVSFSQR